MDIKIKPSRLSGSVTLPPSKSCLHRAIICSGLAKGKSIITPSIMSDDIEATIEAMRSLGSKISVTDTIEINGVESCADNVQINARESGSTLRFLMPIAGAISKSTTFIGHGRLPYRPLTPYYEIFCKYEKGMDELPCTISDGFKSTEFKIPGNISSQFITGLLLAMPLVEEKTKLQVIGKLESKPYVDITLDIMEKFGVSVTHENYEFFQTKGRYRPFNYVSEQDWSSAAFWLVANCIGNHILCNGLSKNTKQGDVKILEIIENCHGIINTSRHGISSIANRYSAITVDVCDIPDLVPILAVLGCFCEGDFVIKNAARLRLKESDRLFSISEGLSKMGADIKVYDDEMVIRGKQTLKGGCTVSSHNDHRIAMALSIAATRCENPIIITNAECVSKSYPDFFKDYAMNGGIIDELNVG